MEHQQYVLGGQARVTIDEQEYLVEPGAVLFIPAGARHDYQVVEAPFEFPCMVPDKEAEVALCVDEREG